MKKQVVVTGASRGIGKALQGAFSKQYEMITISRTKGDFVGDLTDIQFRQKIIESVNPFVFINNAGIFPTSDLLIEAVLTNLVATMHFTIEMSQKMREGFIFNISSVSAVVPPVPNLESVVYATTKKALSDFSQMHQFAIATKAKICTIEPGLVMTDMADIKKRYAVKNPNDFMIRNGLVPMDPDYIVEVIQWIMAQPDHVTISNIRLTNQRLATTR